MYPDLTVSPKRDEIVDRLKNYVSDPVVEISGRRFEGFARPCAGHWYYPPVFSYNTHHHYHYHGLGREDKDRQDRIALGIVFGVIAIAMSFFVGQEVRTLFDAQEDLEALKDSGIKNKKIKKFFEGHINRSYVRLVLKVALFASAILVVAGACMAASPLIVAGLGGAFVSLLFIALNWGIHIGDAKKHSDQAVRLMQELYGTR